jgi:hypothetical protein
VIEPAHSVHGQSTNEVIDMPWARHAAGHDETVLMQVSTECVVAGETVAPGSELELVDAFGSTVERWRNDGSATGHDPLRWVHDDPDLEVQLDGRPLRERPWALIAPVVQSDN